MSLGEKGRHCRKQRRNYREMTRLKQSPWISKGWESRARLRKRESRIGCGVWKGPWISKGWESGWTEKEGVTNWVRGAERFAGGPNVE